MSEEQPVRRISRRDFMKLSTPENVVIEDGLLAEQSEDEVGVDSVLAG